MALSKHYVLIYIYICIIFTAIMFSYNAPATYDRFIIWFLFIMLPRHVIVYCLFVITLIYYRVISLLIIVVYLLSSLMSFIIVYCEFMCCRYCYPLFVIVIAIAITWKPFEKGIRKVFERVFEGIKQVFEWFLSCFRKVFPESLKSRTMV